MRKAIIFITLLAVIGSGVWWFVSVRGTGKSIPQAASEISFPLVGNVFNTITGRSGGGIFNPDSGENIADSSLLQIAPKERLMQIVPRPVAGFTVFTTTKASVLAETEANINTTQNPPKNTVQKASQKPIQDFTKNTYIRYVDRASGYVYEIANGGVPMQVSNVYIPNIYEAFFADNGKKAILRFLRDDQKTIASFVVPVPEPNIDGSRTQTEGFFLPDAIRSFAVSPDTMTLAMLTGNTAGGSILTVSDTQNKNRREIMQNAFRDWNISWTANNRVSVSSKPAGTVPGYLYTISQSDIRLQKVLGGILGLTTSISPSGTYVLYSESRNNEFVSRIYNTQTRQTMPLTLSVLPEKCVWKKDDTLICANTKSIPEGSYPDVWYAGLVSFEDTLVVIEPGSGIFSTLYEDEVSFDATALIIDEESNVLYFINRKDATLWRLSL